VLGSEAPLTIETDVAFGAGVEELEPDIGDMEDIEDVELEPDIGDMEGMELEPDMEDIEDIEDIGPLAGCRMNFINPLDASAFLLTWSAIPTKSFFGSIT